MVRAGMEALFGGVSPRYRIAKPGRTCRVRICTAGFGPPGHPLCAGCGRAALNDICFNSAAALAQSDIPRLVVLNQMSCFPLDPVMTLTDSGGKS